jgi:vancomycin resistance protein YoaR
MRYASKPLPSHSAKRIANPMPHRDYKTILTWVVTSAAVFFVAGGILVLGAMGYARLYEGRIFPGVRVLGVRLDGLTADEARTLLQKSVDQSLKDGLRFRFTEEKKDKNAKPNTREIVLDATTVSTSDPDASHDLVSYQLDKPLIAALEYGRSNNLFFDSIVRWMARIKPVNLQVPVNIDESGIRGTLADSLKDIVPAAQDASLTVHWDEANKRIETNVTTERDGKKIDFELALKTLRQQAERLKFEPIQLEIKTTASTITAKDVEQLLGKVPDMLAHAPLTLTYAPVITEHAGITTVQKATAFPVSTSTLAGWIGVQKTNGKTELTLDPERFHAGLRKLAPDVEKVAKKGSLIIKDGALVSFEPGTEGVTIDDEATRKGISDNWNATSSIDITVQREEPALAGQDPERLGIKEIIGIGRSNFTGSPTNRRKNIANGVKKVNGSLIKPDEIFSLLKTLGPITDAGGWLPELVIKGNKTEPELGGGLCQIGTTTFRAALASGMPIVQRANHSYRVSYYEPAGTDATIYDPQPDFRFKNDMKTHVFIHAYIDGNIVVYEFWGTRDGRIADQTTPKLSNFVSPPPKKLVETLDLKPGKTKCTETAHTGADAEFTYTVTYADGTKKQEVFRSHYKPWQAVCLVGVEKLTEPAVTDAPPAQTDQTGDLSAVQ